MLSIVVRLSRGVLIALAVMALAGLALAQTVHHEFVPDAEEGEGSALVSVRGGAEPAAIMVDGELVTAPEGGALRDGERPMRAQPGTDSGQEVGQRSPTFRPDRVTALPGAVGYFEVFSPSIIWDTVLPPIAV